MTGPDNRVVRIVSMLHDAGIAAMLTGSFAAAIHGANR